MDRDRSGAFHVQLTFKKQPHSLAGADFLFLREHVTFIVA